MVDKVIPEEEDKSGAGENTTRRILPKRIRFCFEELGL